MTNPIQIIRDFRKWRKEQKDFLKWKQEQENILEEQKQTAYKNAISNAVIMFCKKAKDLNDYQECLEAAIRYGIEHKEEILKQAKI